MIPAFIMDWSATSSLKLTLIRRDGEAFLGGFHVKSNASGGRTRTGVPPHTHTANILLQIWILVRIAGLRQHRVVGQFVAQREHGGAGGSSSEQQGVVDWRASVGSWQGWRHQESPVWKVWINIPILFLKRNTGATLRRLSLSVPATSVA